ncbi:MAG TPA: hypothetical protein VF720_11875 [Candidatus Eisenbacteria bacterium]
MEAGGELTKGVGALAEPLEWRVAPWRRDPGKSALAVFVVFSAIGGAVWFSGGIWFFGLLALLMMWGSIGPYFVTSRFVLDAAGAEIDSPFLKRRRAWSEIKSYYLDRHGATLSPFAGRNWLESYRSVRLLFGEHGEAVRRRLKEQLGEPSRG